MSTKTKKQNMEWLAAFASRKVTRYFYDSESEVYLKFEPKTRVVRARVAGGEEYTIKPGNDIVTRAVHKQNEITKEKYENA